MAPPTKKASPTRAQAAAIDFDALEPNERLVALVRESNGIKNVQTIVKDLLTENEGIVNWQDERGHTALWEVAKLGNGPLCNLLLKNKADPNILIRTGSSALHEAVYYNNGTVVQQLLTAGANTEARGSKGSSFADATPLMVAKERNHTDLVKKISKFVEVDDKLDGRQGEYGPTKKSPAASSSPPATPPPPPVEPEPASALDIGDGDDWLDLSEVMRGLKLDDLNAVACAFCKESGADTLAEYVEAELVDELVEYLQNEKQLPKAKAILLKKRIESRVGSSQLAESEQTELAELRAMMAR